MIDLCGGEIKADDTTKLFQLWHRSVEANRKFGPLPEPKMAYYFRCSCAAISVLSLLILSVQTTYGIESRVPEILSSARDVKKWQVIKSTQTVLKPGKPQEVYKVEDYFNIDARETYSKRQNEATGVTEMILSTGGRTYVLDKSNAKCELDRRHHHTTTWPWRGRTTRYSMTATWTTVLGVPGLWLNAIEKKAVCEKEDVAAHSVCFFEDSHHKASARLTFRGPPGVSSSNMLSALLSISVHQRRTVESADAIFMMQDIQTDVVVDSTATNLKTELVKEFADDLKLCKKTNEHSVLFPSLARKLAESEQRNYLFKYKVTLDRMQNGVSSLLEEHTISEWFSYELESQVFNRDTGDEYTKELFYRSMNLRTSGTRLTAFFRVIKGPGSVETCNPYDDNFLVFGGWDLLWRQMHFIHQEGDRPIFHSGTIVGLGALLMNTIDIQCKQLVALEHGSQPAVEPGRTSTSYDSYKWVIMGHKPGEDVYFHFAPFKANEHGETDLGTLYAVTMQKLVSNTDSADLDDLFADPATERLVLRIAIQDFRIHLKENEFQDAKTLPAFCPQNGYEESIDEPPGAHPLSPTKTRTQEDIDVPYEFPSFQEHLELARDYIINSIWTCVEPDENLELIEYFMKFTTADRQAYHYGRLDIKQSSSEAPSREHKYFIAYSTDTMVSIENDICTVASPAPEDWLSSFSSEFKFKQLADADAKAAPLRHYGVGGLWALGSRSPLVEYMGEFALSGSGQYTIWQLSDDPELGKGVSLAFNFTQLATDVADRFRYRLNSIQATNGRKTITIIPSETQIGRAGFVHFVLPPSCDERVEHDYFTRMPEFPSFTHVFGGEPPDVRFKISYDMFIQSDRSMRYVSAIEANKIDSKGTGLVSLESGGVSYRLRFTPEGQSLIEEAKHKRCRLSPDPTKLMMLSDIVAMIIDESDEIGEHKSRFPLANLWNLLGLRAALEGSEMTTDINFVYRNGKRFRAFSWTLFDGTQKITIEFKHLPEKDKLELFYVMIVKERKSGYISFSVKSVSHDSSGMGQFENLERNCNTIDGQFPRIDNLLEKGSVINLRSEIIREKQNSHELERFLADEWMQVGQSFRTNTKVVGSSAQLNNYLVYSETNEFFDLSKKFQCPDVAPIHEPKLGIKPVDPISDHLFERDDQVAFYGPLAMWTLASRPSVLKKLLSPDVDLILLFGADLSALDAWFASDRWLVSHPTKYFFDFHIIFNLHQSEDRKNAISIDRIEATNWHLLLSDRNSDEQKMTINIIHQFDSKHSSEEENDRLRLMDNFVIPVGYGCKRSVADQDALFRGRSDALIFNPLIPLNFEYQASLSVRDGPDESSALTPRPVFISGSYGRCPDTWNRQTYGDLQVDSQHRHYVNGKISSQTHFMSRETPGGDSSEHRLLDHISGSCSIWREAKLRQEIVELDFGATEKVKVPKEWIDFMATAKDQRLQHFPASHANGWREKVVYESQENSLQMLNNLTGPASIVHTFERHDVGRIEYGHKYYHTSSELDVYMRSGSAHLNMQIRNLRLTDCYNIIKRSLPTETCYQSTGAKLSALSNSNRSNRFRELRFEFRPLSNGSDYPDFESSRMSIEHTIIDSILRLEPGLLHALQIGHVNLNESQRDKIVADVRLYALSPPADRFGQLPGMTLERKPALSAIKFVPSLHSCSSICESGGNCFAFSYCPNKECQLLNYDYWIHAFAGLGDPEKKNLVDNLKTITRSADGCTTFYSPTGQPAMTLQSQIDKINLRVGQRGLNISMLHYSFYVVMQFQAVKMTEIYNTVLNAETDSAPATTSIKFDAIETDRHISLAKVQSGEYADVHSRMTFADSESVCLDLCTAVSCNLLSFCVGSRKCVLVGGISSWDAYEKIVREDTETAKACTLMGRDYLADYHPFLATEKPEKYLSLVEDVTRIECATRCHFAGDRLKATDCLSFDFCAATPAKRGDRQPARGSCYLQKLHVVMDDFEASILKQASGNSFSETSSSTRGSKLRCNHYSRSIVAEYEPLEGRKFKNHNSIVLVGNSLDSCALICRRDSACSSFEHCRSHKDVRSTTCFVRRELKIDIADTAPDEKCDIYSVKHFGEEYKVTFHQDGRPTIETTQELYYQSLVGQSELILVGGYLAAAMLIGAVFGVAFYKLMGYPLRILACL